MGEHVRAVVFDFGNVLARFDHLKACAVLARRTSLTSHQVHRLVFGSGLEALYDEGKLTTPDFFAKVVAAIGARDLSFEEFRDAWTDIFVPNPGIEEPVSRAVASRPCFLLSNTNELHWEHIRRMPAVRLFGDRVLLSFRLGARKPAREVFSEAQRATRCEPASILFIDDIEGHVRTAAAMGFSAVRYDCTREPASRLAAILADYGVFAT